MTSLLGSLSNGLVMSRITEVAVSVATIAGVITLHVTVGWGWLASLVIGFAFFACVARINARRPKPG